MARNIITWEGAEAVEETGVGTVTEVDASRGRNARVAIDADHLTIPVGGWADTHDEALAPLFADPELLKGERVRYRVVTHRKRNVDPATPIADLERTAKVRDLIELEVLTPEREQALEAARQAQAERTPQPAGNGAAPPARDTHTAPERVSAGHAQDGPPMPPPPDDAQAPPAPPHPAADAAPVSPDRNAPPPSGTTDDRSPASEAKPWERLNSDGRLNLGSYAVMAAVSMTHHALEALADAGADTSPARVEVLADYLLSAADKVQASITHDGRVDRMATSHTRARGAILTALYVHPVPIGKGRVEVAEWWGELVTMATGLLEVAVGLTETHYRGEGPR